MSIFTTLRSRVRSRETEKAQDLEALVEAVAKNEDVDDGAATEILERAGLSVDELEKRAELRRREIEDSTEVAKLPELERDLAAAQSKRRKVGAAQATKVDTAQARLDDAIAKRDAELAIIDEEIGLVESAISDAKSAARQIEGRAQAERDDVVREQLLERGVTVDALMARLREGIAPANEARGRCVDVRKEVENLRGQIKWHENDIRRRGKNDQRSRESKLRIEASRVELPLAEKKLRKIEERLAPLEAREQQLREHLRILRNQPKGGIR